MESNNAFKLDLTKIKLRLIRKLKWSELKSDNIIYEYKCFLELMRLYPDKIFSPSQEVDEVWHAHILHTLLYAKQCQEIFGRFIHHNPTDPADIATDSNKDAINYSNTLCFYKTAFGRDPPSEVWPTLTIKDEVGCDGCSVEVQSNVPAGCCSECSAIVL